MGIASTPHASHESSARNVSGAGGATNVGAASSAARRRSYGHGVYCWVELQTRRRRTCDAFLRRGVGGPSGRPPSTTDGPARCCTSAACRMPGSRREPTQPRLARPPRSGAFTRPSRPPPAATAAPAATATGSAFARRVHGATRQGCPPARSSRPGSPRCVTWRRRGPRADAFVLRIRSGSGGGSSRADSFVLPRVLPRRRRGGGRSVRRCCCTTPTPRRRRAALTHHGRMATSSSLGPTTPMRSPRQRRAATEVVRRAEALGGRVSTERNAASERSRPPRDAG